MISNVTDKFSVCHGNQKLSSTNLQNSDDFDNPSLIGIKLIY